MSSLGATMCHFRLLSQDLLCHRSLTWCVLQGLSRRCKKGLHPIPTKRFVGSYLQIKEHYKRSAAQAAKYKNLPIIQINASFNNTVITLSDPKGKTLGWVSAGTEGFKNARRGSSTAGRQAGIAAAYKALSLGVESARIKVCGIGTGRQGAINGIEAAGVRVVSVTDVTPVPHNGCRPRKARRL
ncbi:small ribosomal subunit protein uS11-like isoform X2 [Acropora muricata]|uniref:30S ribosomal protein S11-like isoform X2 n=1 Tax=Acropora millepora TaxID=45264 RepID=UPI001CF29DD4|nr:30S ribosomal protein S11-like isoform X2 [Acropora millepora]